MFRLLTEKKGKEIRHEYNKRRAGVMLFGLIIISVVGIVGMMPSYVLSHIRLEEVSRRTEVILGGLRGDEAELRDWLAETNKRLKTLSPALDKDRPSEWFEKVIDKRPAGVTITSLSWSKDRDKVALTINGIARDRQSLVEFEERISSSGNFSEVSLPISNFAKDRDIDFQMKFSPSNSRPKVEETPNNTP